MCFNSKVCLQTIFIASEFKLEPRDKGPCIVFIGVVTLFWKKTKTKHNCILISLELLFRCFCCTESRQQLVLGPSVYWHSQRSPHIPCHGEVTQTFSVLSLPSALWESDQKQFLRPRAADAHFLPRMRKTRFKVISGTHSDPRAVWEHTWTLKYVSCKLSDFMLECELLKFLSYKTFI